MIQYADYLDLEKFILVRWYLADSKSWP